MNAEYLPLSSFEHLMVAQDSPAYPCVVYCKMRFRGVLDRDGFAGSLSQMLERHPLLRARVARSWRGLHWVVESAERVPVQWLEVPVPEDWVPDSRLNLFSDVGVRVFVHVQPNACEVIFQCHHACVDGLGLQAALDDLWILYHARESGRESPLPLYEPRLLPLRNRFGMTWIQAIRAIPKQAVGLLGVRQYLMRDPVPIVPHERISESAPVPLPARCWVAEWDQCALQDLRCAASENRATLNELLTSAVFEAIASFRRTRGIQQGDDWIRMMVPVNMRTTQQDQRQTACNIVSSVFLDRTPSQLEDRCGLLAGIHQEMELIKRNRLGLIFIASLWVKKQWPFTGKGSGSSAPGRCQTTVVVTNVGRSFSNSPLLTGEGVFRTGNLALEEILMLAPMTPFLSAAFTISEYASRLYLALRYDSRILPPEDARRLLDLVIESLDAWMATSRNRCKVSGA